jgi:hypothetical protein
VKNAPLRLGRPDALDTAIELTKRLADAGGATLEAIDAASGSTTVHLSIPPGGMPGIMRMRRRLWASFVDRNVVRRQRLRAETVTALDVRRSTIADASRRIEHVGRYLTDHDVGQV